MGTSWSAQIVAPPDGVEPALLAVLAEMIATMSQWEPASALSRFNREPPGTWHQLPSDLTRVIDIALEIGAASGGAFDPAVGRLADLWGFGPEGRRREPPGDDAIVAALARSGARWIERSCMMTRRTADVALDLSGIGKGYAVDRLASCLQAAGVADFLVEIGGEFVGAGIRPDAQPWWIVVEDPPGMNLAPLRVALHGVAIATSGDYRRFIGTGDGRLGHSIDPSTGRPVTNGVVSTSIIAQDCATADGWATALTIMGAERGIGLATKQGLAARMITDDGAEHFSPALADIISC